MFEKGIFFLLAETAIHAGSGREIGYVDLPHQRNVVTDLPIIQASGVKGALRDFFEQTVEANDGSEEKQNEERQKVLEVFGPEEGSQYSSAVSLSEAKLLFFPVKSLYGIFAYLSCPLVLNQFFKDLKMVYPELQSVPYVEVGEGEALVREKPIIKKPNQGEIVIADYLLKARVWEEPQINFPSEGNISVKLLDFFAEKVFPKTPEYAYWVKDFQNRIAIVSDDFFRDLTLLGMEIVTRNKINNDTGTVDEVAGGLWDEENLPSETILYSLVFCSKPYKEEPLLRDASCVLEYLKEGLHDKRLQIGGHRTVGKGFVLVRFLERSEGNE